MKANASPTGPWVLSLRARLGLISALAIVATLLAANSVLTRLFEQQATAQFQSLLRSHLNQLTAAVGVSTDAQFLLREPTGDPRWTTPYSGLYWQVTGPQSIVSGGVQRSRSLWDFKLDLQRDTLPDGAVHVHEVSGPNQQALMVAERSVAIDGLVAGARIRVMVAADTSDLRLAIAEFNQSVFHYLGILGFVLLVLLGVQLTVGLSPLKLLNRSLARLRKGETDSLEGVFPAEIQPLAENFNAVLSEQRRNVERARTLAGNLAHAVKTPLAVMMNAAENEAATLQSLKEAIKTNGVLAQDQINWHLKRARMAAGLSAHTGPIPVRPVIDGIVSVMQRAYIDKQVSIHVAVPEHLVFWGEREDLLEILGNVIENACKWANKRVQISFSPEVSHLALVVQDDGPGVAPEQRADILRRGVRGDERVPGSGLGLAIVSELVTLYKGELELGQSQWGGLSVRLQLPLRVQ